MNFRYKIKSLTHEQTSWHQLAPRTETVYLSPASVQSSQSPSSVRLGAPDANRAASAPLSSLIGPRPAGSLVHRRARELHVLPGRAPASRHCVKPFRRASSTSLSITWSLFTNPNCSQMPSLPQIQMGGSRSCASETSGRAYVPYRLPSTNYQLSDVALRSLCRWGKF